MCALAYPQTGDQAYAHLGQLLLPEMPLDRDYILVGESFGGPLAIWLALHAPRKPLKLILGATFAASPYGRLGQIVSPLIPLGRFLPLWTWQIRLMLFNGGHAETAQMIHDTVSPIDRRTLLARVQSVLTCDMRSQLAALQMPILSLNAGKDRLIPPVLPRHFGKNIRQIRLGLPHMIFQCDPAGICENHILPFLRQA
ncbi:alpha/beta hydrolase [Asticcacaulis sp. BYS171W]|uniref:Alpha/beta hydrolase n=1 Tax=Asticcacaulis aquaticus TaxID=2984212 RepID=A0ABT5HY39_9CAUL|nr:alpha/beta hydrolase [Asticcacaulis aquaticus]MDC7684366.1 alpha/beta hydrolase [Asticcacaulis aquaticus]